MIKYACIPAFNEEQQLQKLIPKLNKYVDQVIVCDDGSSDNTKQVSEKLGAKVISHDRNYGKGKALKTIFDYVKQSDAEIIVTIDGDGQFSPDEVPKLMTPILNGDADIVIGNRFSTNEEIPSYRKIGNKILNQLTNLASDSSVGDSQSGFRAYSKDIIKKIDFKSNGFAADSEILISASKYNARIFETPVKVIYNTGGRTSTQNPISHSGNVVSSLIELLALKHPLLLLGLPGLILFSIGSIFSVIAVLIFNDTRYFSIPTTLIALGSLLFGLILILMSVLLFSIQRIFYRR